MTGYVLIAVPIVIVDNFKYQIRIHKFKVNNFGMIKIIRGGDITF